MLWFALMGAVSGVVMGWLFVPVFSVAISSSQILLLSIALWLAGQLTLGQLLTWAFVSLLAHQGAYLCALILRDCTSGAPAAAPRSIVNEVENDLELLDNLAERIEAKAPNVQDETEDLCRLATRLRRALIAGQRGGDGFRRRSNLSVC